MKKVIFCGIFFVIFSTFSFAETLTLGYVSFPPYEYIENGKPAGILVTIVQEIFKKSGYDLVLKHFPFKRALKLTKEGKIDGLFNFYKNADRLKYFDYSEPVIKNPLVFFVRKDSVMVYTDLNDLKNKKISVMRGYTYGAEFDKSNLFKKDESNKHESSFRKVGKGRSDAYPCDKLVGISVARKDGLMSELKILPNPLKVMDGHIGFTKGKHTNVIKRINSTIIEMQKSGTIEKIIDDYVGTTK